MNTKMNPFCLLLLTLTLGALSARGTDTPRPTSATAVPESSIEVAVAVPQSLFVIPASPKEGRNPFFPRSKSEMPVAKVKPETIESFPIILNGITSPPKRMAMINGRTFETGETGDVKLQNGGKISIQCIEITNETAVIVMGNQRRELRLRSGL